MLGDCATKGAGKVNLRDSHRTQLHCGGCLLCRHLQEEVHPLLAASTAADVSQVQQVLYTFRLLVAGSGASAVTGSGARAKVPPWSASCSATACWLSTAPFPCLWLPHSSSGMSCAARLRRALQEGTRGSGALLMTMPYISIKGHNTMRMGLSNTPLVLAHLALPPACSAAACVRSAAAPAAMHPSYR